MKRIVELHCEEKDWKVIKTCLDYCWHRLLKHHYCGIKGMVRVEDVDRLRKFELPSSEEKHCEHKNISTVGDKNLEGCPTDPVCLDCKQRVVLIRDKNSNTLINGFKTSYKAKLWKDHYGEDNWIWTSKNPQPVSIPEKLTIQDKNDDVFCVSRKINELIDVVTHLTNRINRMGEK